MPGQPQPLRLTAQLSLGHATAGDHEADVAPPGDDRGERVERQMEPLFEHQPPDHQDQPLGGTRVAGADGRQVLFDTLQVAWIDSVGDRRDPPRRDAEHRRDVPAHVVRAGDQAVRAPHHRVLGGVDVGLRMLLHPALMAPELGRMHGHQPGDRGGPGDRPGRLGHQPVVRVDEVEPRLGAQLVAAPAQIAVHAGDPAEERIEILGERRLAHPVNQDAAEHLLGGRRVCARGIKPVTGARAGTAREDVQLDAAGRELLGELVDVPAEPTLDQRRVLPRDQQHTHPSRSAGRAGTHDRPARTVA